MPEVIFTGPAGRIEGRYHPARQKNAPIGIVLHPHPQFGGTMNHQIVYQLYYAFVHRGFSALRFNFPRRRPQPGRLRPRHRRTLRCRGRARLGANGQSRGAQLLDRRLLVRRLDRHAASDAPAGDRRFHLDRAAGQSLRLFVPRALPVVRADHPRRQGCGGAAARRHQSRGKAQDAKGHRHRAEGRARRQPLLRRQDRTADEQHRRLSRQAARPCRSRSFASTYSDSSCPSFPRSTRIFHIHK
jgi:hypothetical protein